MGGPIFPWFFPVCVFLRVDLLRHGSPLFFSSRQEAASSSLGKDIRALFPPFGASLVFRSHLRTSYFPFHCPEALQQQGFPFPARHDADSWELRSLSAPARAAGAFPQVA